jgi:hypothetical protein
MAKQEEQQEQRIKDLSHLQPAFKRSNQSATHQNGVTMLDQNIARHLR